MESSSRVREKRTTVGNRETGAAADREEEKNKDPLENNIFSALVRNPVIKRVRKIL